MEGKRGQGGGGCHEYKNGGVIGRRGGAEKRTWWGYGVEYAHGRCLHKTLCSVWVIGDSEVYVGTV